MDFEISLTLIIVKQNSACEKAATDLRLTGGFPPQLHRSNL